MKARWLFLPLGAVAALLSRSRLMHWGARRDETAMILPGDELLDEPDVVATRAITIGAPPERVWPWIAQIGQDRGGFYSYTTLENLFGMHVDNADEIVEQWQNVRVGDTVKLHPDVALDVAVVEPGRALVLAGSDADGAKPSPFGFTWAFVVLDNDGASRLVIRERYKYTKRWAPFLVEPFGFVSSVMTRKTLHGIRERAEREQARASPSQGAVTSA